MDLRNPFGLRDNQVILIEDISKQENGRRCNCVCPFCKEPFEARMGDIRRHHFAHSGQGCDEINAYMTGLYMLLNEFISSGNSIVLPPVVVSFDLSPYYYITDEDIEDRIRLQSVFNDEEDEILVFKKTRVKFQSTQIETANNGRPKALIAEAGEKKLAIIITPPDTVCKTADVKRYKDYPTIEIDFSNAEHQIRTSTKGQIYEYIKNHKNLISWIYNPRIKEAYSTVMKKSKEYYDNARARMKEEQERKKERKRKEDAEKNRNFMRRYKSEPLPCNNTATDNKTYIESAELYGVAYSVGDTVSYKSERATIIGIWELINKKYEIQLRFQNGDTKRCELNLLIDRKYLLKV